MKLPVSAVQARAIAAQTHIVDFILSVGRQLYAAGFTLELPTPAALHTYTPGTVRHAHHIIGGSVSAGRPVGLRYIAALASTLLALDSWTTEQCQALTACVVANSPIARRRLACLTPAQAEAALERALATRRWHTTRAHLALLTLGVAWPRLELGVELTLSDKTILIDYEPLPGTNIRAYRWLRELLTEHQNQLYLQSTPHQARMLSETLVSIGILVDVGPEKLAGTTMYSPPAPGRLAA